MLFERCPCWLVVSVCCVATCLLGVTCVGVTVYRYYFAHAEAHSSPAEPPMSTENLASFEPGAIDVTPREVASIPPGKVILDGPPKGWSHLIIKSQPHVGEETKDRISGLVAEQAGLLFTAIVADVQEDQKPNRASGYRLAEVAIGAGTEVDGRDMILTPETQEALGAKLSFLQRPTLRVGLERLREMRCMARGHTMAILDSPGVLLRGEKHLEVTLRYAILVNPETGQLDTLLWTIEPGDGENAGAVGPMQWLPPNKVEDCVLHVDPGQYKIPLVPGPLGFAMIRLPQGRETLDIPEALKSTAAGSPFTPESARELEKELRKMLHSN